MSQDIKAIIKKFDNKRIEEYKNYWTKITPTNDESYYWRWVFSFLSVHCGWEANVNSYLLLKNHAGQWLHSKEELTNLLRRGGCGLYTRRTEGLWLFKYLYWENPQSWRKQPNEEWWECRGRLEKRCRGLGYAKTAFALEMCYPTQCESVCLDTHMLQLYGYTSKEQAKVAKGARYIQLENEWLQACKEEKIPAYIARCLFWDTKQYQPDSRYWSYVFE